MATYEQIRIHLQNIPINQVLKVELVEISPGYCRVIMPYNSQLTNSWHGTHGGILMTLADMAFYLAQATLNDIDASGKVTTTEVKTNFLNSSRESSIRVEARVIKNGKRIVFGEVSSYDNRDVIISHSTVSYLKS